MSPDAAPAAAAEHPKGGATVGLDAATVDALASRLADNTSLRLPGSLSGQVQEEAPARSKRVEYLTALLQRDPGVFLGKTNCTVQSPIEKSGWLHAVAQHAGNMCLIVNCRAPWRASGTWGPASFRRAQRRLRGASHHEVLFRLRNTMQGRNGCGMLPQSHPQLQAPASEQSRQVPGLLRELSPALRQAHSTPRH